MDKKCPDCDAKMTVLFTSYVCETCNPVRGPQIVWHRGYTPLYNGHRKDLDRGIYVEAVFRTPEKARAAIRDVYGHDPNSNLWTIISLKSTQPIKFDHVFKDDNYLCVTTNDIHRVLREEREDRFDIPYVHLVEVIK